MLTPSDVKKLDDDKVDLNELERMIDESIIKFHGDYPWEEAVIEGEYSDRIMQKICLKYKGVGWRHVYWSRSSENGERPGLTNIKLSATTPLPEENIKNIHPV